MIKNKIAFFYNSHVLYCAMFFFSEWGVINFLGYVTHRPDRMDLLLRGKNHQDAMHLLHDEAENGADFIMSPTICASYSIPEDGE